MPKFLDSVEFRSRDGKLRSAIAFDWEIVDSVTADSTDDSITVTLSPDVFDNYVDRSISIDFEDGYISTSTPVKVLVNGSVHATYTALASYSLIVRQPFRQGPFEITYAAGTGANDLKREGFPYGGSIDFQWVSNGMGCAIIATGRKIVS